MKKIFLLLISIMLFYTIANAQYKLNKSTYDYRSYKYQVGDPYSPVGAGLESILIPGLGQVIADEPGRGIAFFAGATGFAVLFGVGVSRSTRQYWRMIFLEESYSNDGVALLFAGLIGYIFVDVWSAIDGVRVAKVNNLAFLDKNNTTYRFEIQPYINTITYNQNGSLPLGLSIKIRF